MATNKEVGNYLKKRRKDLHLSQGDLADRLYISYQSVSKWELGESLPSTSILLKLAEILETTVDQILLAGTPIIKTRKYKQVRDITDGINALKQLKSQFGDYFYRGLILGLNQMTNKDFSNLDNDHELEELLLSEIILANIMSNYAYDRNEIEQAIKSKPIKKIILKYLGEEVSMETLHDYQNEKLFAQIRGLSKDLAKVNTLNRLPGEFLGLEKDKEYLATQVEVNEDYCYGLAIDDEWIYLFSYERNGANQKLISKTRRE